MTEIRTSEKLDDETLAKLILKIRDDRILVRKEPTLKAMVAAGLVLPDDVREDQFEQSPFFVGRVVMCGPGMAVQGLPGQTYEMDVKPGDRITFHKAAHDQLFLNGERFLVIGNRDVSMVISDDAEVVQVVMKRNS